MVAEQILINDLLHELEIKSIVSVLDKLNLGEHCKIKGIDIKYVGMNQEAPSYGRRTYKYKNGVAFGTWSLAARLYFNDLNSPGECRWVDGHCVLWKLDS
ncbi:hypothetical protein IAI10_16770 [Clostridium sp. 19966]|uniref:hypothetical protein n=1 Tax=Clostridium sp. 19966 TaxID=2768166 RepID=UPI0028DFBAA7|nr:hypothetical protein [Clostridium sp. 19966]MDT8718321.1 hypothetical protein [Clostridium sp. 19966]